MHIPVGQLAASLTGTVLLNTFVLHQAALSNALREFGEPRYSKPT
jgi:hypothetical protein